MNRPARLEAILDESATPDPQARRSVLHGIVRGRSYLSEWEDDTVVLDMGADRHGGNATFDLSKIMLRCNGPASPFEGVRPVLQFPHLRDSFKALLNQLVVTFQSSNKLRSEVSRNFNAVLRFCSWSTQNRGITTFSDLTRRDFEDFLRELATAKHGIIEVTGCLPALDELVAKVKSGELKPEDVCSSGDYSSSTFVLREEFISSYLGLPIEGLVLPNTFLLEMSRLCGTKARVGRSAPAVMTNVLYSYTKALNRLWELPSVVDRPSIKPYPSGQKLSVSLAGDTNQGRGGRTENISPENAIKIIEKTILWIFSYATHVIEILGTGRNIALACRGDEIKFWPQFLDRANAIATSAGLPFEIVWNQSPRRNGENVVSIDDLTGSLMTACFCLIAINHGRRQNEIIGVYGLKGGLYFGCIQGESLFPGLSVIELYVEKTLKDWAKFGANALVRKGVEVLEALAQVFRGLDEPLIERHSDQTISRSRKLFRRRVIIGAKSWEGALTNFIFGDHSSFFFASLGLTSSDLDSRAHPYRRIFAIVYYHRFEDARLLALTAHLRHLLPSTTLIYVTDPSSRETADRINQMYGAEHKAVDDDVRSESFVRSIVEILKGDKAGGKWPAFVLGMYARLLEAVEFSVLDIKAQGEKIAETMTRDGYGRSTFYFGGCNVGQATRTAAHALCADEQGKPRLEKACPSLCIDCVHHDSNDVTLTVLDRRAEALELEAQNVGGVPAPIKEALLEEATSLRRIIESERALKSDTIKLLSNIRNSFALVMCE